MNALLRFYEATHGGTVLFGGFAAAALLFVLVTVRPGRLVRRGALAVLGLSTLGALAMFIIRWVLAGRVWYLPPIMNQFEAVTASAMLAAAVAWVMELRSGRGVVGLAASLYATVALLAGLMLGDRMGAAITPLPGILHTPIMPLHVATIIVGHGIVGMSAIVSAVYLVAAACGASPTLRQSIDRANVALVHLSLWLVTLGTALGAYWGDLAWGRWWGWDPKETWALMTMLIYFGITHLRLAVPQRRRAWTTALGCLIGAAVMLFNWIAVNYLLKGLHSYA